MEKLEKKFVHSGLATFRHGLNNSINDKHCYFLFIVFDFHGRAARIINSIVAKCSAKHSFTKCLIPSVTDLSFKSILKHISLRIFGTFACNSEALLERHRIPVYLTSFESDFWNFFSFLIWGCDVTSRESVLTSILEHIQILCFFSNSENIPFCVFYCHYR